MSIIRFDLAQDLDELRREVGRMFNANPMFGRGADGQWIPPLDTVQEGDTLVVRVDLPGLDQEDVSVEVQDDQLVIHGARETRHEERDEHWFRLERASGEFERRLILPDRIDPETVDATFDKGVLTVRVPAPSGIESGARRIPISSGSDR